MKAYEILLKKIAMVDPFTKEMVKTPKGEQAHFSYRVQLYNILTNTSNERGITTEDVMNRSRVQFTLTGAEDDKPIFLEEAHYNTLKKCIDEMKWGAASMYVAEMIDAVRNAKVSEMEKKEEKPVEVEKKEEGEKKDTENT